MPEVKQSAIVDSKNGKYTVEVYTDDSVVIRDPKGEMAHRAKNHMTTCALMVSLLSELTIKQRKPAESLTLLDPDAELLATHKALSDFPRGDL